MKSLLKSLFIAVLVFSFSFVNANNEGPISGEKTISEISTVLNNKLDISKDEEATVKVQFTVTEYNEIVILHTDNTTFDSRIKDALNYHVLENHELKSNEIYIVPVRIEKK